MYIVYAYKNTQDYTYLSECDVILGTFRCLWYAKLKIHYYFLMKYKYMFDSFEVQDEEGRIYFRKTS